MHMAVIAFWAAVLTHGRPNGLRIVACERHVVLGSPPLEI